MKPAPFSYRRALPGPETAALRAAPGDRAKTLAGGQSLAPMMNFRLARAGVLADVTVRGHLRDGAAQEFATNGGGR